MKVSGGPSSLLRTLAGGPSCLPQLLVAPGFLGFRPCPHWLCSHLHAASPLLVCLSLVFLLRMLIMGFRATLIQDGLISRPLTSLHLQRAHFQIRSHSQSLGGRT